MVGLIKLDVKDDTGAIAENLEHANKKHINKVTIYDSLKILNFSVEQIAKDFNLPISKLEINYKEIRKRQLSRLVMQTSAPS